MVKLRELNFFRFETVDEGGLLAQVLYFHIAFIEDAHVDVTFVIRFLLFI
jgi:hypothetical protein